MRREREFKRVQERVRVQEREFKSSRERVRNVKSIDEAQTKYNNDTHTYKITTHIPY
jgi:hypothetical protein